MDAMIFISPTGARGFSRLQLRLETLEKLPGEFLGGLMKQTCSDAGNRPAHRHLGSPIHARMSSINGRKIHPANDAAHTRMDWTAQVTVSGTIASVGTRHL